MKEWPKPEVLPEEVRHHVEQFEASTNEARIRLEIEKRIADLVQAIVDTKEDRAHAIAVFEQRREVARVDTADESARQIAILRQKEIVELGKYDEIIMGIEEVLDKERIALKSLADGVSVEKRLMHAGLS